MSDASQSWPARAAGGGNGDGATGGAGHLERTLTPFTFVGYIETSNGLDVSRKLEDSLIGLSLQAEGGSAWIAEGSALLGSLRDQQRRMVVGLARVIREAPGLSRHQRGELAAAIAEVLAPAVPDFNRDHFLRALQVH